MILTSTYSLAQKKQSNKEDQRTLSEPIFPSNFLLLAWHTRLGFKHILNPAI